MRIGKAKEAVGLAQMLFNDAAIAAGARGLGSLFRYNRRLGRKAQNFIGIVKMARQTVAGRKTGVHMFSLSVDQNPSRAEA